MSDYKPYIVSWNVTKRCNLLCPHCYIDSTARLEQNNSELTTEEARHVIDELSYINDRLMLVLSGGEPLLRRDIYEIIEYASSGGFIPVLGTNGILLTKEVVSLLKEAGLRGVGVSIDSVNPEEHDRFRGFDGAWELSVSGLRYAREAEIETQLDVTLTDRNYQEIDRFIEFGVGLGVKAINFFFLICTGRAMKTDISTDNYESALRHVASRTFKEKRLMVRARCAPHIYRVLYEDGYSIPAGTRGCLAGRSYMRIDPEGYVTPCPYMPVIAGNIRESSLSDIWEGASYLRLLREGNYKGRCGICEYTEICGGCRARALVNSGDMMDEDSLCGYVPEGKGKVTVEMKETSDLKWDERAKERIKNVPTFMRNMIVRMIESKARKKGIDTITSGFIDELKKVGYSHGYKKIMEIGGDDGRTD
ncbi:MAG: radical SAM protein [Thermodesulfovibrionales bacterium]